MKLPNAERAYVPNEKVRDYLLSLTHPNGRSKAEIFRRFGFSVERWEELARALLNHGVTCDVQRIDESRFGMRYIIEGDMATPDGRSLILRSVWFIPSGKDAPRLTTAYPLKRNVR